MSSNALCTTQIGKQAIYDVKLKTPFFTKFFPDITIDFYEEASRDPAALQQLIDKVVGTQVACKAFLYKAGAKSSITLHPQGSR